MEYNSMDEIVINNNQLDQIEIDMLIKLISGCKELTDKIRLDVINTAIYNYSGTVVDALVETLYWKNMQ